jgi:orotidine-5'-phosphate decarboxylase
VSQLIAVLDTDTSEEALGIVSAAQGCNWFKIGSQLFTRCGPAIVHQVQDLGNNVFLDLKYHDIPNTVAKAARAAADLGVDLFTLHASGGTAMIGAAREVVEETNTRILAVTVLTSLSDRVLADELGLHDSAAQAVARLARLAVGAGAHGIVCSPREIGVVRDAVGDEPLVVTPGIRPAWASKDDQARVMTPRQAGEAGADFIVVGRPISGHKDPAEAVRLILEELS